jgi:hypothetical protein
MPIPFKDKICNFCWFLKSSVEIEFNLLLLMSNEVSRVRFEKVNGSNNVKRLPDKPKLCRLDSLMNAVESVFDNSLLSKYKFTRFDKVENIEALNDDMPIPFKDKICTRLGT